MAKFNVGDKVRCIDDADSAFKLLKGNTYIVEECSPTGVSLYGVQSSRCYWATKRLELVEEAPVVAKQPTFDLRNTKINVKAYAEKHGITLEKAHEEIQSWLFEHGYNWNTLDISQIDTHASYLYIRGEELLYGNDEHRFYVETTEKEVALSRQVVLTLSYVEEEFVEFDGKKYNKREFLAAIANVKEKTNER